MVHCLCFSQDFLVLLIQYKPGRAPVNTVSALVRIHERSDPRVIALVRVHSGYIFDEKQPSTTLVKRACVLASLLKICSNRSKGSC